MVLKHDDVSRKHASVEITAEGLVVRDLSTNGTFVEGKRVAGAQPLPFGKPVKIGPFLLRFRLPGQAAMGSGPVATRTASGEVKKPPPPPPQPVPTAASATRPLAVEPSVVAEHAVEAHEPLPPPPPRKKIVGVQENAVTTIPDLSRRRARSTEALAARPLARVARSALLARRGAARTRRWRRASCS